MIPLVPLLLLWYLVYVRFPQSLVRDGTLRCTLSVLVQQQ